MAVIHVLTTRWPVIGSYTTSVDSTLVHRICRNALDHAETVSRGSGGPRSTLDLRCSMQLHQVVEVLDGLDQARVRHWVAGGWGVDALIGAETRPHRDLDLAVDAEDFDDGMETLAGLGYTVETDSLPLRVEVAATGERWVDVHPVRFDRYGHGIQGHTEGTHFQYPKTAFTAGLLGGRRIPCLSASQQALFHSGYELRPQDQHDLRLLAALRV